MTDYMPAPSKEAAATPAGSSSNSETAIEKSGEAGDLLPETLPGARGSLEDGGSDVPWADVKALAGLYALSPVCTCCLARRC